MKKLRKRTPKVGERVDVRLRSKWERFLVLGRDWLFRVQPFWRIRARDGSEFSVPLYRIRPLKGAKR